MPQHLGLAGEAYYVKTAAQISAGSTGPFIALVEVDSGVFEPESTLSPTIEYFVFRMTTDETSPSDILVGSFAKTTTTETRTVVTDTESSLSETVARS
jgi:hypothetical protein